jgi:hypothetical protein
MFMLNYVLLQALGRAINLKLAYTKISNCMLQHEYEIFSIFFYPLTNIVLNIVQVIYLMIHLCQ